MIFGYFKNMFLFCVAASLGGGGGSSTATTNVTTTTNNSDSRMVVSDSGVGISGNTGTVNMTSTDHGAVAGVFDFLKMSDNANQANYGKLLAGTGDALKGILTLADKSISDAQNKGQFDNKTIAMIALGGLATLAFIFRTKK